MKHFAKIPNSWKLLTTFAKHFILYVSKLSEYVFANSLLTILCYPRYPILRYPILRRVNTSASKLNNDFMLYRIEYTNEKFDSTVTKAKTKEVLFSRKTKLITHPPLFFIKSKVKLASIQKHLGLNLILNCYLMNIEPRRFKWNRDRTDFL